jgi:triosephosphate isomerase
MRTPLVAGNWKMHGSKAGVNALLRSIISDSKNLSSVEIAVFPPYVFLEQTERMLASTSIKWGAQNVSAEKQGAFTGEISAEMLLDFGCRYTLVGHSERRRLHGETDAIVAAKFLRACQAGLHPVLCVGETLEERQTNKTEAVIQRQIEAVLNELPSIEIMKKSVIAYEPVWAIGTGVNASPEQAQSVHAFIRQYLKQKQENIAEILRIIYGGSVKAANAASLLVMPDIDGALVGGASLQAQEFIEIAKSCNKF